MSSQLDILALEPFYGGARRAMLDTVMRYSRHRWTLLKLPPRRIDRRLQAAAIWFSEQLSRHWAGRVDVLFVGEAMNLSDLLKLTPVLAHKPSVVYFHDNQLPGPDSFTESPLDMVNLISAMAATELWFNSDFHLRSFARAAGSMVERHPEIAGRSPLAELDSKSSLMLPPVDLSQAREFVGAAPRNMRTIFIDTRGADMQLLNTALGILVRRNLKFDLITVGPLKGLDADFPRRPIAENDEEQQIGALHEAGVLLSTRLRATTDHHAVRGLALGCRPVFPNSGVYPELLPAALHPQGLYDGTSADRLANCIHNVWHMAPPSGYEDELDQILHQFSAIEACRAMDHRLEELATGRPRSGF